MTPRSADDRYREARGLIEDLIAAWPGDSTSELLIAAQRYVQTHCQQCGRALVGQARAQGDVICRTCQPGAPQERHYAPVPPRVSVVGAAPGPHEPFDAVRDSWPEQLQPVVEASWDRQEIQALRQYIASARLPFPLRGGGGKPGEPGHRQHALADPQFQQLLVDAARADISVRTLAAVLFGTTPGKASDDIARAIDAYDPTARKERRR